MSHPRTDIRDAVVAKLIAGGTLAGPSVFPTRKANITLDELPLICVYILTDATTGGEESAPRELQRETPVHIECWRGAGDDFDQIDTEIDEFCAEVEAVMDADRYFEDLDIPINDSVYAETIINLDVRGDQTMAMALITYDVEFRQLAPEPGVLLPLNRVDTQYDIDGDQDVADQARDLIELPGPS